MNITTENTEKFYVEKDKILKIEENKVLFLCALCGLLFLLLTIYSSVYSVVNCIIRFRHIFIIMLLEMLFQFRSMTCGEPRSFFSWSFKKYFLYHLTENMSKSNIGLLYSRCITGRNGKGIVSLCC